MFAFVDYLGASSARAARATFASALALLMVMSAGLATAQAQTTTITAAWDRNSDTITTGYVVQYGTAPGSYQWTHDAGNNVSTQLTLNRGSRYYFAVRAYNASAQLGPASNEATVDLSTTTQPAAPTASLTATLSGSNAVVTWQTANAVSATINGTNVALSGTQTVPVTATTTFTLVARNSAGATVTRTATVTVAAPAAPTASISATLNGGNAVVTWQTANAVSATINGTNVALSGTQTVPVTATTTFTIVARNSAGASVTRSATVTVAAPAAPTASISATLNGSNAVVTWQTSNASAVTINGTNVALSGTQTVPITATTTFTLVARNSAGASVTRSATVTVSAPAAPTASISATLNGSNAVVTWQTSNASAVTINGTNVALSGTQTVPVTATTTFTLVARNSAGASVTRSATVTVAAAPTPTASFSATLQGQTTAVLTWQTSNATTVTINGNAVALSGTQNVPVSATTGFTLVATNRSGVSVTRTATVTISAPSATGAPNPPTNLASSVAGARVTLAWVPPVAGGTPQGYQIDVGMQGTLQQLTSSYPVGNVRAVTADLPRGSYWARVRAVNATGRSGFSNVVTFTVGTVLQAPSSLRVRWVGTTASLEWSGPSADVAAEDVPTNYVLEAGTAPGMSDVLTVNLGKTTRFSAPIPAGTYYVRIRAVNDLGASAPTEDVVLSAPGAPGAPRSLVAGGSAGVLTLDWQAPTTGGAPVTYQLEAGTAPGLSDLAVAQVGNVTSFSTAVPPGTYYVRVKALNAMGVGMSSNEVVVRR